MIFFFYGPNTFAARRKLGEMVETYLKKTGSNFGLERIDGSDTNERDLLSALQSAPFLTSSRLVIIDGLSQNKVAAEKIQEIIKNVPSSTVAVFYDGEVDQRTTYFKVIKEKANAVKFEKLSEQQLVNWVKQEVTKLGGRIDRPALAKLIQIVGDDQWRLEQELIKLVNYQPDVTVKVINELVVASPAQTIFELVDAMSAGQAKRALTTYHNLLEQNTNEHYILTMVVWQLRNLLLAKAAGNITSSELARAAGMSPYVADKALDRRRGFEEETLKQAFLAALETEYQIKSGQGEAEHLVEQLIFKISSGKI